MADYEFEGQIDSDGNISGTFTERGGYEGGPLPIFPVIVIYALCLIGGIILISNVASQAPFCIVPAILAFIIMLIPIFSAIGAGNFMLKFLISVYKCLDLLMALFVSMFWIALILELFSVAALMGLGLGLTYLTIFTVIKSIQKAGVLGGILTIAVPFIIYVIVLALSNDFLVSYFAIIPTSSILISLIMGEIVNIKNNVKKVLPIIRIVAYLCVVASMFLVNFMVIQNKAMLIQQSRDYISEGKYLEARQILQDIKSEEAKELYTSIRYTNIQVGEIIYNGYYQNSDARSISENAVAFICLDVSHNQALFISLDVIGLSEQYGGLLDETVYTENYSLDTNDMATLTIANNESKFFLLSKVQYNLYIQNDSLDDYLKKCKVSSVAQEQKKSVDKDNYKWTYAYTDFWLLNDFTTQGYNNYIGTINCETGEFEYKYNSKLYAGIRLCYYANINN